MAQSTSTQISEPLSVKTPISQLFSCSYGIHSNVFNYMDTIDIIRTKMASKLSGLSTPASVMPQLVCINETLNNRLKKFLHTVSIKVDIWKLIINGAMIRVSLGDDNKILEQWPFIGTGGTDAPSIIAQFIGSWKELMIRRIGRIKHHIHHYTYTIHLDVLKDNIQDIVKILSEAGCEPTLTNGKEVKKLMACKTLIFDVDLEPDVKFDVEYGSVYNVKARTVYDFKFRHYIEINVITSDEVGDGDLYGFNITKLQLNNIIKM